MKRVTVWGLLLAATLSLVAPAGAAAHVRTLGTRLWMTVDDTTVVRGERVTFFGRLRSDDPRCVRDLVIRITRKGQPFARARTNDRGRYRLTRAVVRGGAYRAVFVGSRFGSANEHDHRCAAATTDPLRIRIA